MMKVANPVRFGQFTYTATAAAPGIPDEPSKHRVLLTGGTGETQLKFIQLIDDHRGTVLKRDALDTFERNHPGTKIKIFENPPSGSHTTEQLLLHPPLTHGSVIATA